jgi:2-oxo-3-hexenedioate decarboxylase
MADDADIEAVATAVKAAQDSNRQIEPITSAREGFRLADGYEVARRIHAARLAAGAVAVGRKIGFTNSNIWRKYGVEAPIWSYVYDTTVTRADNQVGTCSVGGFGEPKIEPEIVVQFREGPPANGNEQEVLACIDWVAHGFEIVQSIYPGWRFQAPDTAANSGMHGALLIGEPVPVEKLANDPASALAAFSITLFRNGEAVESGKGSNVLGSPIKAVAHLAATLAGQPDAPPLAAGELVTTGTLTGAHPAVPGETWSTELSGIGLPGLTVNIEA